ncbi:glutathione S-transferase family protein [Pseudenhygromyxa sp. WMMC2535]|uniref:glutathione S-transferase family protein n=1 Tax=Pseudenhygromyxa sp. WMMC2535 TaxID=2712867 RepID=UPI001557A116|nr:glutathione S-transferase family protein [Pseudenhygromyxa sp. WMMC2535]NVB38504.1 glutathione S-transferase family protein [Pseudenhygromyxa sp. WMMC2535]
MAVKIYRFGPGLGQPDLSPFCTKLILWLRMAGIDYEAGGFDPKRAPKGKAPYAELEGELVGDSSEIIARLTRSRGVELDAGLSPMQRAQARAVQSMVEEDLYFVVLYMRWQLDAVWSRYADVIGGAVRSGGAPGLLVPLILRSIRKQTVASLRGQGMGRHAEAEVVARGLALLEALEVMLGEGPYFFGEAMTSIDATVYSMVAGAITPELSTPLQAAAKGRFPGLEAYLARVQVALFDAD